MTPSILGLAPSASSLPEFLDVPLIENLWQQASVFNPIISFAGADLSGGMYLGSINFSLINGPITNYSVLPQSDRWSLGMNGIAVGNSSLGYNGELTVVFNSPYHMMPKPAFNVVRQLLNFTGPTFTQGNVMVASGSCLFGFNPPNITYTVDGKNLTLTPSQYIQTTVNPEVCYLLIAGWAGPAPQGLTYTLGSSIFISGSYAVFNYANATFGLAELDSSPV